MKTTNEIIQRQDEPILQNGESISWPAPLLDAASAVADQKLIVAIILLLGLFAGVFRLMTLPTVYKASAVAVLMSRDKPMLDASIDTSSIETANDSANRSSAGNLMLPPNPALYTTLIKSRAVLSSIATKYNKNLSGHLSPGDRSDEVIQQLTSMVQVTSTEEGLITVTVSSSDPQLSANLANEFFEECKQASKAIERQLILQQAGHLDDALESAVSRLENSEKKLGAFTAKFGLVDLELQAGNQLRSIREMDAKRDDLENDLQELLLNYSERSPEVQRIRARIGSIEKVKKEAEGSIISSVGINDFGELIVLLDSLKQKVRFERDLVATLSTKADIYRIRADQPTGNLAIVRAALAPDRPAGPSKKRELGIVLGVFSFIAFGWCIASYQWSLAMSDPYLSRRLNEIKAQVISPPYQKRITRFFKLKRSRAAIRANA